MTIYQTIDFKILFKNKASIVTNLIPILNIKPKRTLKIDLRQFHRLNCYFNGQIRHLQTFRVVENANACYGKYTIELS